MYAIETRADNRAPSFDRLASAIALPRVEPPASHGRRVDPTAGPFRSSASDAPTDDQCIPEPQIPFRGQAFLHRRRFAARQARAIESLRSDRPTSRAVAFPFQLRIPYAYKPHTVPPSILQRCRPMHQTADRQEPRLEALAESTGRTAPHPSGRRDSPGHRDRCPSYKILIHGPDPVIRPQPFRGVLPSRTIRRSTVPVQSGIDRTARSELSSGATLIGTCRFPFE